MKKNNAIKLIIALIVPQLFGIMGSLFTSPKIDGWYSALARPSFNPPSWLFAPVWTTLFLLMGISAYLIWKRGLNKRENKSAMLIFMFQLCLNLFWSFIFFGLQSPGVAFTEIISLWFAILATIIAFFQISKTAGYLMIPYILWVSFAAFLNYNIWQANGGEMKPVVNINPTVQSQNQ